jgi:lambda family phage portal protein
MFQFFGKNKVTEPIKKTMPRLSSDNIGKKGSRYRAFQSAAIDRLTSSLNHQNLSIDQDIVRALPILRAFSRDLTQNNDYARKFIQMVSTNVVGSQGFVLHSTVSDGDKLDAAANNAIEVAFWKWSKKGNCDVTGRYSFVDIQHLAIKAVARDGECLIRKVYSNINPFGFALQILDIDRLNVNLNENLRNGNIVKMGVEMNCYGKVIAYHLHTKHPGDNAYYIQQSNKYEIVPADEIYHLFVSDRPEQTRGYPFLHSAIKRLQNLGGYEEAAIIAARVGAAKMGFYTTPEGDGSVLADDKDKQDGTLLMDAEPGTFQVLPEGYDFKSFDPDYPHAQFGDFVKAALRGIASGLGVAYNTLSNDLENVNFSSIRSGTLEERDNWTVLQNWFIENLLDNLFSEWLRYALLNSAITLPNGTALPLSKYDKFNNATWQGRRWSWVDPKSDIQSNILAIQNGLKSRSDVIAEQGKSIEDVWAQTAREIEMAKTMGIELPPINAAIANIEAQALANALANEQADK